MYYRMHTILSKNKFKWTFPLAFETVQFKKDGMQYLYWFVPHCLIYLNIRSCHWAPHRFLWYSRKGHKSVVLGLVGLLICQVYYQIALKRIGSDISSYIILPYNKIDVQSLTSCENANVCEYEFWF